MSIMVFVVVMVWCFSIMLDVTVYEKKIKKSRRKQEKEYDSLLMQFFHSIPKVRVFFSPSLLLPRVIRLSTLLLCFRDELAAVVRISLHPFMITFTPYFFIDLVIAIMFEMLFSLGSYAAAYQTS